MAELLTREKELFKMNQELNLMSLHPPADELHGEKGMSQSRYATYLKQKGPSTLLKNKFIPDSSSNRPGTARSAKQRAHNRSGGGGGGGGAPSGGSAPATTATSPRRPAGQDSKLNKGQHKYSTVQPTCRIDSTFTRKAAHKTHVTYRNSNFLENPSLEMLRSNNHNDNAEQDEPQLMGVEVTQQTRESTTVISGQNKKHLTQDNFIKFLKAKVVILEEDHSAITQEMRAQRERLDETMESLRKSEAQRDQAINSNTKLTEQLQRLESQNADTIRRQKERQTEYTAVQRELEMLKRDNKLLKQANANLENRLGRANDENESTRVLLNQQSGDQRDEQEFYRKEIKLRDNRIKALKKQRADLLNAYKKQLFMIDNLKRQNCCVEQAVAIGFGEKEFNKVLEWNTYSSCSNNKSTSSSF